ncbi:MAG TPA: response regulator [Myxococcota bacterium]|nr:response regulator [Myxococcota bacterium]
MARVLVVDDSATMRKIIVKGLREAGFSDLDFAEAPDGASALEALRKQEFDLVLSDINMPGMDGLALVRCVRDEALGGADLPIVMITTEGGLERVQEALAAGANDYLRKPFTPEQLQKKLTPFVR